MKGYETPVLGVTELTPIRLCTQQQINELSSRIAAAEDTRILKCQLPKLNQNLSTHFIRRLTSYALQNTVRDNSRIKIIAIKEHIIFLIVYC